MTTLPSYIVLFGPVLIFAAGWYGGARTEARAIERALDELEGRA